MPHFYSHGALQLQQGGNITDLGEVPAFILEPGTCKNSLVFAIRPADVSEVKLGEL